MHKGCFRDPSSGWCSLVTDLAGADLPDITDGKALQNPHCDTRKGHMHLNGADNFQDFSAGLFAFHTFQGRRLSFFLVIAQLRHMLCPETVTECANMLFQLTERTFDLETVAVEPYNGQWVQYQAGARQNALGPIRFPAQTAAPDTASVPITGRCSNIGFFPFCHKVQLPSPGTARHGRQTAPSGGHRPLF